MCIIWWFVQQREVSPSHCASGPRKRKKTSGIHSGEKASANMKTLGRGTKCSEFQSNTEWMTTKMETFRKASSTCTSYAALTFLTPALSTLKRSLLNYPAGIGQPCNPATLQSAVVGIKSVVNIYIRVTEDVPLFHS